MRIPAMSSPVADPAVSIILPTYNRVAFLSQAFEAICAQTFTDWELIIVDDGSTDETAEVVAKLSDQIQQPTRYVRQANEGPYGARNTGLDLARGRYIAFYDSDDLWLPHHLNDCVDAFRQNPQLGWVYAACQVIDRTSGRVVAPNTFYAQGKARPFLSLRRKTCGKVSIINDPQAISCQLTHGLYCGLQASVIRATVFYGRRFPPFRIAEDQALVIDALAANVYFGYIDCVHVHYQVHEGNISSVQGEDPDKKIHNLRSVIACMEYVGQKTPLTPAQRRALRRRLLTEYFWHLGYAVYWQSGRKKEAISSFRQGLQAWAYDWRAWKTYLLARLRCRRER